MGRGCGGKTAAALPAPPFGGPSPLLPQRSHRSAPLWHRPFTRARTGANAAFSSRSQARGRFS